MYVVVRCCICHVVVRCDSSGAAVVMYLGLPQSNLQGCELGGFEITCGFVVWMLRVGGLRIRVRGGLALGAYNSRFRLTLLLISACSASTERTTLDTYTTSIMSLV